MDMVSNLVLESHRRDRARRSARAALEQMSAHYDARLFEARARNRHVAQKVAEAPWSGAEWAVALRFDHSRATVTVLVLG